MKILAKFLGKVTTFNPIPNPSYVTLKNLNTGEMCNSTAETKKLLEKGIDHSGCEFEIIVTESVDGTVTGNIQKMEPIELTYEESCKIHKVMNDQLGNWSI